MAPILLYVLLVLGAIGVLLALPGGRIRVAPAALIALAGLVGLLLLLLLPAAGGGQTGWMPVLVLLGLWGGVRVVTHGKPVYSALFFIVVVISVASMLVLLEAEFLAAALVIIYAGAILVTYVFVIMLAQQAGSAPYDRSAREPLLGVLAGFVILAAVSSRLLAPGGSDAATAASVSGGVGPVGTHLLTQYMVGVQVAALLLTAAMVGAIAIARRHASEEGAEA